MNSNTNKEKGKCLPGWAGALGVMLLMGIIAFGWSSKMGSLMWSAAASDPNAAQARIGEETKVVLEITEAIGGEIRGTILREKSKEVYTRTVDQMRVASGKETKFVMGKAEDMRAGAVVHVTGKMQEDRQMAAQQIVILTGYVRIEQ